MSWAGAIDIFRKLVPPVPPSENQAEPLKAAPIKAVPPVPPVPPEKMNSQHGTNGSNPEAGERADRGQGPESQNGGLLNFGIVRNQRNQEGRLDDQSLSRVITRAAHQFGLSPAALWSFLGADDIEALRRGTPDLLGALWAFAESRSLTGDTLPGGHDLPFPGTVEPSEGLALVCCGDCDHFQPDTIGDGTGIGRCGRGIQPGGGLMYPKVERSCRGFGGHGSRGGEKL